MMKTLLNTICLRENGIKNRGTKAVTWSACYNLR